MTGPITGYPLPNTYSNTGWNFNGILSEFRSITGIPDPSQYSDAQCATLINYYYQFVLPKELKIFWGYTYYQFWTQPNVDQYVPSTDFQTLNPSVTANGFPVEWYTDPNTFYSDYPQQTNTTVVGNGNGTLNSFTYQIPAFPIIIGSLYATDGTQIAQDNGAGGFVDPNNNNAPLSGTINYATGAVSGQSFTNPPAANTNISQSSQTFMPNRPQGILYFKSGPLANATQPVRDGQNYFVLRPVPDNVYLIKMQGIQVPPAFLNYTDVPFRPDLGPLIALGAALHRFKLFNQMDQYDQYLPEYNRFKDVCMQDTYEELLYQRAIPAF